MRQNSVLIHLFFYNSIVSLMMFWALTLLSTHQTWCKSWTRTPGPGTSGPWDPGPPSKFKSGTRDPLKFKSGTPGPPSKFKSGTSSTFFNEFIFLRIFNRFLSLCLFEIRYIQKNINCELQKSIANTKDK